MLTILEVSPDAFMCGWEERVSLFAWDVIGELKHE